MCAGGIENLHRSHRLFKFVHGGGSTADVHTRSIVELNIPLLLFVTAAESVSRSVLASACTLRPKETARVWRLDLQVAEETMFCDRVLNTCGYLGFEDA